MQQHQIADHAQPQWGTQGGGGGSGSVWMNGYSIALSVRYNWSGFKINECGLLRTTHAHRDTQTHRHTHEDMHTQAHTDAHTDEHTVNTHEQTRLHNIKVQIETDSAHWQRQRQRDRGRKGQRGAERRRERESRRGEDRKKEREAGRKWEKVAATGLAQSTLVVATQRSLCSELATVNTPKAIQFWTYLRCSLRHWRVRYKVWKTIL